MRAFLIVALCSAISSLSFANTIHVPGDQPTIQAGVDAASPGDTVLVAPGSYVENIDFKAKNLLVRSERGAAVTIIDGNSAGSAVTCRGTGVSVCQMVLEGFTVTNGNAFEGGGLYIESSTTRVRNCIF